MVKFKALFVSCDSNKLVYVKFIPKKLSLTDTHSTLEKVYAISKLRGAYHDLF